jgi:hypothetical protein
LAQGLFASLAILIRRTTAALRGAQGERRHLREERRCCGETEAAQCGSPGALEHHGARDILPAALNAATSRGEPMTDPAAGPPVSRGVQPVTSVQNPLTLVMAVKSPADAQTLNALLLKIQSAPPEQNPIWRALNKLNTVHFARFVFLEQQTKLAVITTYDGSFDDYINEFIDEIGDVFNALLTHMTDAPPLPVQQHRQAFLDYVRANDLRAIEPFYSAYPTATVLDIKAAVGN